MKKKHLLLGLVVSGLLFLILVNNFKPNEVEQVKPEVKNGYVVLKSFQTEPKKQTAQSRASDSSVVAPSIEKQDLSSRAEKPIPLNSKQRETIQSQKPAGVLTKINDLQYQWLSKFRAKRSDQTIENGPTGYSLVETDAKAPFESKFDSSNLLVFLPSRAHEKVILTGAIIVKYKNDDVIQSITNDLRLELSYHAPQIQLAVFQLQTGQDIFENLNLISKLSNVKKATLELLGRGATAQ